MSSTTTLNYSYNSGTQYANVNSSVSGTATGKFVYVYDDGSTSYYSLDTVSGAKASGGNSFNKRVDWEDTRGVKLPSNFHTAVSVTGDTTYISYGKTADGTRIDYSRGQDIPAFFTSVGPGGTVYCYYSSTDYISGSWTASVSDLNNNWQPEEMTKSGALSGPTAFTSTVTCGGTHTETFSDTFYGSSSMRLTYLTEAEANRGQITVTPTANSFPMNTTASANIAISGNEVSYFTVKWLLRGNEIVVDSTHYPITTSTVSTDAYVESILGWDDNLASVVATVYAANGEELSSAIADFIVVGPPAPPTIFNIEKFGIGIGQVAAGTEESPLVTSNMRTVFTAPITAKNLELSDGWHALTLASGVTNGSSICSAYGAGMGYRVEGQDHVYIRGDVAFTPSNSAEVVLASGIPSKYRPANPILGFGVGASKKLLLCKITTDGQVVCECALTPGSNTLYTSKLNFSDIFIDYWI